MISLIALLAGAGLLTSLKYLLKPTQVVPVATPAPIDYASERSWLLECLRRNSTWCYHVEQISGECHSIEIRDFSDWKSFCAGHTQLVYQARFYMLPTTSQAVRKHLTSYEPHRVTDLLEALEAEEAVAASRRKLRVRRLRRDLRLASLPLRLLVA